MQTVDTFYVLSMGADLKDDEEKGNKAKCHDFKFELFPSMHQPLRLASTNAVCDPFIGKLP